MDLLTMWSQFVQNVVFALAIVIGGVWAIYRYQRSREEKLSVEFDVKVQQSSQQVGGLFIASLLFIVRNTGSRALRVAQEGVPFIHGKGTPQEEHVYRNCELRIWRLETPAQATTSLIPLKDAEKAVEVRLGGGPVNILAENGVSPNRFWLEPGEIAHFATSFYLPSGYYAGRIVTVFDMRSLTTKKRYTFDTFSFAFEIMAKTPNHISAGT